MRVKYPIDNLDNRIKLVANSYSSLINLPLIGYALMHSDFTNNRSGLSSVTIHPISDYPDYIALREEENINKQKDYIIIGLDFALEYLNEEWINDLIRSLRFRNGESDFGRWRKKVKEIILGYITNNKEEFSEIYLELMLG